MRTFSYCRAHKAQVSLRSLWGGPEGLKETYRPAGGLLQELPGLLPLVLLVLLTHLEGGSLLLVLYVLLDMQSHS